MIKPDLSIPTHDGALFRWRHGEGTVDASDLHRCIAPARIDGRVWSDACDVGFYIRSHRTGEKRLFLLENVGDNDGDITHWTYRECSPNGGAGVQVFVFND